MRPFLLRPKPKLLGRCVSRATKQLQLHDDLRTRQKGEAAEESSQAFTLGRTLMTGAVDGLGFDRPGTSNGPTEAINRRREHFRGSALESRHPTDHIARSLSRRYGGRGVTRRALSALVRSPTAPFGSSEPIWALP